MHQPRSSNSRWQPAIEQVLLFSRLCSGSLIKKKTPFAFAGHASISIFVHFVKPAPEYHQEYRQAQERSESGLRPHRADQGPCRADVPQCRRANQEPSRPACRPGQVMASKETPGFRRLGRAPPAADHPNCVNGTARHRPRCRRHASPSRSRRSPPIGLPRLRPLLHVASPPNRCRSKAGDRLGEARLTRKPDRVPTGHMQHFGDLRETGQIELSFRRHCV